ncbi:hypothetical protein [Hymenobacter rigui]|uniref:hypothetical protein n=1 Tax=Hymenobacter rigui TaxID=334424 RepID=UPI00147702B6|nr:hypothetical protein [Hymenobacter rigui]
MPIRECIAIILFFLLGTTKVHSQKNRMNQNRLNKHDLSKSVYKKDSTKLVMEAYRLLAGNWGGYYKDESNNKIKVSLIFYSNHTARVINKGRNISFNYQIISPHIVIFSGGSLYPSKGKRYFIHMLTSTTFHYLTFPLEVEPEAVDINETIFFNRE